jgi:hypothetical protein
MALDRGLRKGWECGNLGYRIKAHSRSGLSGRERKGHGTYVTFVVPGIFLFGEHALQPFAV